MKAILCTAYGPPEVLRLVELEKPTPKAHEVLVRIKVSTTTYGDCEIRNLTLPMWTRLPVRLIMGYRKPRRLTPGMEFAGVVEAIGSKVSVLNVGDEIFGTTGMNMGGNAEFICRSVRPMPGIKPKNVSFEDVVTIPVGGINALHFLRMAKIKPGQKVLVIGAGGSIGTWGVLLAKHYGAEVTAVDHGGKLAMLKAIGADHVIDYTKEDFSERNTRYDVIFDNVYTSSFTKCIRSLTPEGYYLMANTGPLRMLRGLWVEMTTRTRVKFALATDNPDDLNFLVSLIETQKIKPVIDRSFPLEQTMDAHRYVEQGLKKGSVLIQIS